MGNPIVEGIGQMITGELTKLHFDKTIKAKVFSVVDMDTGEYRVQYTSGVFPVFSNDLKKIYKVGDDVYVKVPEGDFSNKKFIESRVSDNTLTYSELAGLQQSVSVVSPGFNQFYNGFDTKGPFGVIAGAPLGDKNQTKVIFNAGTANPQFQQYANKYDHIRIYAYFKTDFHSTFNKGNYGLEVKFLAGENATEELTYRLHLYGNDFTGDPYRLSTYSPQSCIIEVQKGYLKGLKSITLFEEDFPNYDEHTYKNDQGETIKDIIDDVANIFAQNIQLEFVELKDLSQDTLFLDISTPKGVILNDYVTSIDLVGRLISEGQNILNTSNSECSWYIADASILPGSELYQKQAGAGWRKLDTTSNTLTLDSKDVVYRNTYKLIVVYNKRNTYQATIEVINGNSTFDCGLAQVTSNDDIELKIENFKNDEVLLGNWFLTYPDLRWAKLVEQKNSISIKEYLTYSTITFYCQVIKDGKVITQLQHTITASENEEDLSIVYRYDEDTYRYNADGQVTLDAYEQSRWLKPELVWKDGKGTDFRVEYYVADDNEQGMTLITPAAANAYSPKNSMMENVRLDNNGILYYNIKKSYGIGYTNNKFFIKVITIDERVFNFEKEIIFLKDGDQGTNGTEYIIAIRPCDNIGLQESSYKPIYYKNNAFSTQLYRCYVYRNSEEITNDSSYSIDWNWDDCKNLSVNQYGTNKNIVTVTGISGKIDVEHYLRCEVKVRDTVNDSDTKLYSYYPVDLAIAMAAAEDSAKIDVSALPLNIQYSASGNNASYDNRKLKAEYDGQDYAGQITSLTNDLINIVKRDDSYYLRPAISYIGDIKSSDMGVIKCPFVDNKYIVHTIIMFLNTFGNEAINGWDGKKLVIDKTNGKYIFAPQVGAGEKNTFNQFTGVLMAKGAYEPAEYKDTREYWGLYGFQNGVNTFGLDENGRAWFGPGNGKGQIRIGDDGQIYGVYAHFNQGTFDNVTGYNATFTNSYVQGTIYAGDGKIGGWTIAPSKIYTNGVTLDANDGLILNKGSIKLGESFTVKNDGTLKATDGFFKNCEANHIILVNDDNTINTGLIGTFQGDTQLLVGIQTTKFEFGIALESGADFGDTPNPSGRPVAFTKPIRLSGSELHLQAKNGNIQVYTPEVFFKNGNNSDVTIYGENQTSNFTINLGSNVELKGGKIYAYFG